jgi:hypothetical protein
LCIVSGLHALPVYTNPTNPVGAAAADEAAVANATITDAIAAVRSCLAALLAATALLSALALAALTLLTLLAAGLTALAFLGIGRLGIGITTTLPARTFFTLTLLAALALRAAFALLSLRASLCLRTRQLPAQFAKFSQQITGIGLASLPRTTACFAFRGIGGFRQLLLHAFQRIGNHSAADSRVLAAVIHDVVRVARQDAGGIGVLQILRRFCQLAAGARRLLLGLAARGVDLTAQRVDIRPQLPPGLRQASPLLLGKARLRIVAAIAQRRAQIALGAFLPLDQFARRVGEVLELLRIALLPATLQLFARAPELFGGACRSLLVTTLLRLPHLFQRLRHLALRFCCSLRSRLLTALRAL